MVAAPLRRSLNRDCFRSACGHGEGERCVAVGREIASGPCGCAASPRGPFARRRGAIKIVRTVQEHDLLTAIAAEADPIMHIVRYGTGAEITERIVEAQARHGHARGVVARCHPRRGGCTGVEGPFRNDGCLERGRGHHAQACK